jgi:Putative adhesin
MKIVSKVQKITQVLYAVLVFTFFLNSVPAQRLYFPLPTSDLESTEISLKKSSVADTCDAVSNEAGEVFEKSLAVNEKVNISICVRQGQVKVNGWNRNEIRAFVNDGSEIGFSVLEKSKSDKKPVWVKILGFDPKADAKTGDECVSGRIIELDVPIGATVNIKSGESETTIDSVAKVAVKNVGGDIYLSNIPQGVEARTYRGNVTVKNSGGPMNLETTNGNILAYETASDTIGDVFRAKTNSGDITLQKTRYRETEVNSNSGSINFVGEILAGGQYYFGSTNSLITLVLPEASSSKIVAVYGYGGFDSEIPLKDLIKEQKTKLGSLTATFGTGEALLNFKTVTGKIIIKKQ